MIEIIGSQNTGRKISEAGEYKSTAADEKPLKSEDILSNNCYPVSNFDIISSLKKFCIFEESFNPQNDPEFLESFFETLLSTKIFSNFNESLKVIHEKNHVMGEKLKRMREGIEGLDLSKLKSKLNLEHEKKVIEETRNFLKDKEKDIETDTDELNILIGYDKNILEDKKKSFVQKLKKASKLEINTIILNSEKTSYEETLKEYNEKIEEHEQEKFEAGKEMKNLKNKLNLATTEYLRLLKDYEEISLQEGTLNARLESLQNLKEELNNRFEEKNIKIKNKIREIEDEKAKIHEAEQNLELKPMKLEKELEEKSKNLALLRLEHLDRKTRVEVMKEELTKLSHSIEKEQLELKKISVNEMEIREKKEEYGAMLKDYLEKKSEKIDLQKKFDFHAKNIKKLTELSLKELRSENEKIKITVNREILDEKYVSLQDISRNVKDIEMRVREILHKQEQFNNINQSNLNSFRAMGIQSNIGSITTSNYEFGAESSEKSKEKEFPSEELDYLKKEVVLISEKIENLQNELKPQISAISRYLTKNQSAVDKKLSKFLEELQKRSSDQEIGGEISKVVKEDLKQIVQEVINSRSSSISEHISFKSSSNRPATVIIRDSTPSDSFSENIRKINYVHKNSDYYHIMQFLFKMSSLFVNTMADLIKDSRNYHHLREEIIR